MSSTTYTRAQKQKYQTSMTHLLTIQNKLRILLKTGDELRQQVSSSIQQNDDNDKGETVKWDDMPSSFKRRIRSGVITNLGHLDIISFLNDAKSLFKTKIQAALKDHIALKVNTELAAEYIIQMSDSVSAEVKYFNTENAPIYETTDLQKWFNQHVRQAIQREMEEFQEKGSGWSLRQILSLVVNINKLNPMKENSYISLRDEISKKKLV